MRVAIINPPLLGHETRGTGVYTQNLMQELADRQQIKVIPAEISNLPRDVDLYHFPYFDPFFLTLPFLRAKKTVVTVHDLIPLKFPQYFPRGIRGEVKWQIQRFILRGVEAIITDSQASAGDIMTFIGVARQKIFPIPLAPAAPFFKTKTKASYQHIREKYHLPGKYILYVGDVNWNKNVEKIIMAATSTRWPLVIVSKPFVECHDTTYNPWKESLLNAQQLAKNNKFVYKIGHISTEELVGIYKLAACLVFPSHYEGFGLPVVEAFAAGCPVVTSDKGSLAEITGGAALLVDPQNENSIIKGITDILSSVKLRQELIQKGQVRAKQFSWAKTAAETVRVYRSVLQKDTSDV